MRFFTRILMKYVLKDASKIGQTKVNEMYLESI